MKKYFTWVQNSVFEGEITLGKLEKCKRELLSVIEKNEDSVYFYEMEYKLVCNKKVLGQEKNYDSIII
ncbi:CRISPR-associated protein Cas2 [Caldicellulosiruptor bescii]|nr:CRISPR-associated protein Cas2 [Caldicellulosiruptor bescii]PBC92262.1 CRISPR-associated protein Cas2 [Caldicellulosiruptor bescii]PBD05441.1 CRISPR-associated protein Cas2 [Caldicellulosiruptor bescii]PBD08005.1 CRISPR-associated protein Cas2 [Caldicellulosiruptor bescii]PFH17288.1 CRISPR-associated Cas2 family protein [Caldicellulosiruptor bescii]